MSISTISINCSHLKNEVPLTEGLISHLYRCVFAAAAIVHKTKKPQAQLFLLQKEYQKEFNAAMETVYPEQVISKLGLMEYPWQFLDINVLVDEFLSKTVSEKRDNLLSLSVDRNYNLTIKLRTI